MVIFTLFSFITSFMLDRSELLSLLLILFLISVFVSVFVCVIESGCIPVLVVIMREGGGVE